MVNEEIRLNRYIAKCGLCSRREADVRIAAGRVFILPRDEKEKIKAHTGMSLQVGDRVFVDGRELDVTESALSYYLYHKPAGVVCTTNRKIKDNILERAGVDGYLSYAGRLDKASTGLVLLTNDTEVLHAVTAPKARHEKEYLCTVDKVITDAFLEQLRRGVFIVLDDERHLQSGADGHTAGKRVRTRPCVVVQRGERAFSIILTQGFNRQIRRMCQACGYRARSIHRVRMMSLQLGDLPVGQKRELTMQEQQQLKEMIHEHG